jgi:hypothetical protein
VGEVIDVDHDEQGVGADHVHTDRAIDKHVKSMGNTHLR